MSPTNGTAAVSGTNVLFVPAANFLGVATIGYKITDGIGGTNLGLITVSVTNRPPVAANDAASTPKNVAVTIPVLANDSDPDGNLLSLVSVSPTNGTANISGTNVVFTPATNFLGAAFVGYTITDGNGGTNSALITIAVTNRPPVAVNDFAGAPENVAVMVPVLVNDSDPDGDALTIAGVSPTNGTAGVSGTNILFTPATNFLGIATVGYVITDGFGGTNFALLSVSVTNNPPLANPDNYSMAENTTNTFSPLVNDVVRTPGGNLSIVSVSPTNGVATIIGTNITFTPTLNFAGITTIGYTITDGIGGTNSSLITVTVTNLTMPSPVANAQSVTTLENTAKAITLTGSDPESLPLTFAIISNPANGTLTLLNTNTGAVTYTPNTNYSGADSFTFRVNNGHTNSLPATVAVTVSPMADLVVVESGPTNGVAGSNLVYTVSATNRGPATATGLVISNQLSSGFTFVSASAFGANVSGLVTWNIGSLPKNGVTNLTVTVFATEGGAFTNIASGASTVLDLNPTNNNGSLANAKTHTVISALADVAVFKDGGTNVFAGDPVAYTITATNAGPSTAANVVVKDNLPAGAIFQSASGSYSISNGVVTWPGVTLAPHAVASFNLTLVAPATVSSFVNVALSTSPTADPNPTNNNGSFGKSRVTTKVAPSADVVVFLLGPASAIQGSNFVYTLTVTNAGPSTSSNVVVSDSLPLGLTFVSASSGGKVTNGIVTWPLVKSLAAGTLTNFSITVSAQFPGVFTNIASALAATYDPNPTNNSGVLPAAQVQTKVGVSQFGILAGAAIFNPQTGLYEENVTVTNTGNVTILGFRLHVGGLRSGVTLWNANGTNNGVPFVNYNFPVDPSNAVGLILEFYDPLRQGITNTLAVEAIVPGSIGTSGTNNSVGITTSFVDTRIPGDTRFVIEFGSVPGRTYVVIYSGDLAATNWNVATPSIKAGANVTQWYDDGPPKTESKPASIPQRYYRVIQY